MILNFRSLMNAFGGPLCNCHCLFKAHLKIHQTADGRLFMSEGQIVLRCRSRGVVTRPAIAALALECSCGHCEFVKGRQSKLTLTSSLLCACSRVFFSPVIAHIANQSLSQGCFPTSFQIAQVRQLLKKPGLDQSRPSNLRPISNLSTGSKILERLMSARLRPHLLGSDQLSQFQSGCRPGHSTKTTLLYVLIIFISLLIPNAPQSLFVLTSPQH